MSPGSFFGDGFQIDGGVGNKMAMKDFRKVKQTSKRINWKYIGSGSAKDFDTHIFIEERSNGWVYGLFDEDESNEFAEGFSKTKEGAIKWAKDYMKHHH